MAINSWLNPKVTDKISECVPFIQKALNALLKMEPASISDIPTGAKRMTLPNASQWKIEKYDGSNWVAAGKLMHDVDTVDGYHAAITPAKNTLAVRNADGVLQDSITGNAATATKAAALSAINPVSMGGTGSNTAPGARTNLGVPPIAHASTANTYGLGSSTDYGHLKLSDAVNGTESVANGTAATPTAVKAVNDSAVHTTGDETIAGTKTFTVNPKFKSDSPIICVINTDITKGDPPSSNEHGIIRVFDKNGSSTVNNSIGEFACAYRTDGACNSYIAARTPEIGKNASASIGVMYPASGYPFATCPTPIDASGNVNTSDNSTKIATTQWVTTKINNDVPPPFPSGTKMLFAQSAAPTGWTKLTTVDDAAIRIVSGDTGGGTGGSVAFSTLFVDGKAVTLSGSVGATTLTVNTIPSHTHAINTGSGINSQSRPQGSGGAAFVTYKTGATGGSGSHTHTLAGNATIAMNIKYLDVILCQKD